MINQNNSKLWLLLLFFIFLVVGLVNLLMSTLVNQDQNNSNEFKLLLSDIAISSEQAVKGDVESFEQLLEYTTDARLLADKLFGNQEGEVLNPQDASTIDDIESLEEDAMVEDLLDGGLDDLAVDESGNQSLFNVWSQISASSDMISNQQESILAAISDISAIKTAFPDVSTIKQFQEKLIDARVDSDIIGNVNSQQLLFDILNNLLEHLYDKDVDHLSSLNSMTAFLLDTSNAVLETNKELKKDSPAIYNSNDNFMREVQERFSSDIIAPSVKVVGNVGFKQALDAKKQIENNVASIGSYGTLIGSHWYNKLKPYFPNPILNILPFVLAALSLFAYLWFNLKDTAMARQEVQEKNRENQEAIIQLMDELSDVADGDLTVSAMVTEGDLGVVADIINDTIERLRGLVSTVDNASSEVTIAVVQSQTQTTKLFEATQKQSQEIERASNDMQLIANSIEKVSLSAKESANVAQRSVEIAQTGGETVNATITGMERIREQIQDTSKRIKRLGESSQEIGDIVALISDIADQTNILALNSAIQASMAGEAGRGFAVVSDEIQRLAERTTSAAKQIESLVRTIQAYTNEAVSSMEETTSEVVIGTDLAQNAGIALDEIQSVSESLAELISGISTSSGQQANSASQVSEIMKAVDNITRETSTSTKVTADSIQNLNELSIQLQETVSGFQLPS